MRAQNIFHYSAHMRDKNTLLRQIFSDRSATEKGFLPVTESISLCFLISRIID